MNSEPQAVHEPQAHQPQAVHEPAADLEQYDVSEQQNLLDSDYLWSR